MPNIRTYTAQDTELSPNNLGASAEEQAGRLERIDYNELGSNVGRGIASLGTPASQAYDQYVTQPEITNLVQQGSAGMLGLTQRYNALINSSDPSDPTVTQKFFDQDLNPFLEKLAGSATTQAGRDFVQKYGDQMRDHFGTVATADQSTRSGIAATGAVTQMTNNSALMVNQSPDMAPLAFKNAETSINSMLGSLNLAPALSAKIGIELKANAQGEIAAAALQGMAYKNPVQFQTELEAGKHDDLMGMLKPDAQNAVRAYAQHMVKAQSVADNAQATLLAKQQKAAANAAQIKLMSSGAVQPDGSMIYTPEQIKSIYTPGGLASMPGVTAEQVRTAQNAMIEANAREAKGETVISDASVYQDDSSRAFLDDSDPNKLTVTQLNEQMVRRQLSSKDYHTLMSSVTEADPQKKAEMGQYNKFISTVLKPLIIPGTASAAMGSPMYAYNQRWLQAQQDIKTIFNQARAGGTPVSDLLNPASPKYILNIFPYKAYQLSQDQDFNFGMQNQQPVVLPPVQGETNQIKAALPANPGESVDSFMGNFYTGVAPGQPIPLAKAQAPTVARKPGESISDYMKRTGQ